MANKRISKDKQALVLAALCEGTPINAVARMFKVGKHGVLRIIRETGEAFAAHMDAEFRDLPCERIEMDELVFSHMIGTRRNTTGTWFVHDVSKRVSGPVQIATDNNRSYACNIRQWFGYEGYSYGTETKIFGEPEMVANSLRKNGIPPVVTSDRKAVIGSPDLASVTTSHIERVFLSVRQECKRFQRLGLGYSKDLETHKLAIALHFGIYNYCRKHKTLGTTPAVAAGLEEARWSLEQVVEMTEAYWEPRRETEKQAKAEVRRDAEDAMFEAAINSIP